MIRALTIALPLVAGLLSAPAQAQAVAPDVPVAVLAAPVALGDRLDAGDFIVDTRPAAVARGGLTPAAAAGKEALRYLPAGAVVRAGDVGPPRLVHRGEPVTVRYVQGGLVITGSGRALGSGGTGDPVRVVLTATSRTLDAVVDGAGTVRVVAP